MFFYNKYKTGEEIMRRKRAIPLPKFIPAIYFLIESIVFTFLDFNNSFN